MKSTSEYIAMLCDNAAALRRHFGVRSLCLLGSVARGEQREGTDVDPLIKTTSNDL